MIQLPESGVEDTAKMTVLVLCGHLGAAFVLGAAVAGIAAFSHHRTRMIKTSLLAMLVMMSILIAMVTLVVDNSLARAFSLAGVLAIIRFRTVIEDTRDTAYVIASVGMGLAAGAGFYVVAMLTLPLIFVTTWIFRTSKETRKVGEVIEIRLETADDADLILEPLWAKYVHQSLLVSMNKNRKGSSVDLQYAIRLKDGMMMQGLMGDLQKEARVRRVKVRQKRGE